MRESLLGDHKLKLEELASSEVGQQIMAAAATATGRDPGSIAKELGALPGMDLYVGSRAARRSWSGGRVRVVALVDPAARVQRAYGASGDSIDVDDSPTRKGDVLLVLSMAGDRNRRIGARKARPGAVVQDEDESEITGSATYFDANGDSVVVDLADILTADDVAAYAAPRSGSAGQSSGGPLIQRGAREPALLSLEAGGPADTTRIAGFITRYREDHSFGGDGYNEPFFKAWRGSARGEVRFTHIRPGQYYYPNVPLIFARVQPWIANRVDVVQTEDNSWALDKECWANSSIMDVHIGDAQRGVWVDFNCTNHTVKPGVSILLDWTPKTVTPPVARLEYDFNFGPSSDRTTRSGCARPVGLRAFTADGLEFTSDYIRINARPSSSNPAAARMIIDYPFNPSNPQAWAGETVALWEFYSPGTAQLSVKLGTVSTMAEIYVVRYVTSLGFLPTTASLQPGERKTFYVARYGANGNQLPDGCRNSTIDGWPDGYYPYPVPTFSTDDPSVATVTPIGSYLSGMSYVDASVTAQAIGSTVVRATWGNFVATANVTVQNPGAIVSVSVSPSYQRVYAGQTSQAWATAYDAFGTPIYGRPVSWSTSDPASVSVDEYGSISVLTPETGFSVDLSAVIDGVTGWATIVLADRCTDDPYWVGCDEPPQCETALECETNEKARIAGGTPLLTRTPIGRSTKPIVGRSAKPTVGSARVPWLPQR